MDPGRTAPLPLAKWIRAVQAATLVAVAAVAYWQLASAGFQWRQAMDELSPWGYFLAMATLPVFGFPISACYIGAGLAFPFPVAAAVCLGALVVNLSASYFIARGFLRQPMEAFFEKRGWKLPQFKGEGEFRFAFLVRTIPGPPFFFQNIALSLVGIPFPTYMWISLLTQGSIGLGVAFSAHEISQDPSSGLSRALIAVFAALILAKALQTLWKRLNKRRDLQPPIKKA